MPARTLQFGIPALDRLIGYRDDDKTHEPLDPSNLGIRLGTSQDQDSSVSLCMVGPEGVGKSALTLHMAARYAMDTANMAKPETPDADAPLIFYVSTDLSLSQAERVFDMFQLGRPDSREQPFAPKKKTRASVNQNVTVKLHSVFGQSVGDDELGKFLLRAEPLENVRRVGFIDLQNATAGDDWGLINRIAALMPDCQEGQRHLLVIDAIEGLETLAGGMDSFGMQRSRRSRIAQIVRTAGKNCHLVFVVEETKEGNRLDEEFIADVVIRLRSDEDKDGRRRTISVEKARSQYHARGEHPFVIRDGAGSTTGIYANPDDPRVPFKKAAGNTAANEKTQAYIHVFHSLDFLSRTVMEFRGQARPELRTDRVASFGIRYLDDFLRNIPEAHQREISSLGFATKGLPCGTVTSLIGDAGTQKSRVSRAFLAQPFAKYAENLVILTNYFRLMPALLDAGIKDKDAHEKEAAAHASDLNQRPAATGENKAPGLSEATAVSVEQAYAADSELVGLIGENIRGLTATEIKTLVDNIVAQENQEFDAIVNGYLIGMLDPVGLQEKAASENRAKDLEQLRQDLEGIPENRFEEAEQALLQKLITNRREQRATVFVAFRAQFYTENGGRTELGNRLFDWFKKLLLGYSDVAWPTQPDETIDDVAAEKYCDDCFNVWTSPDSEVLNSSDKAILGHAFLELNRRFKKAQEKPLEDQPEDQPEKQPRSSSEPAVEKARLFLLRAEALHTTAGVSIYMTTQDNHVRGLAQLFLFHVTRSGRLFRLLKNPVLSQKEKFQSACEEVLIDFIQSRTLCRRFEIQQMTSAQLHHVFREAVREAQKRLTYDNVSDDSNDRFDISWNIRMVLEDLKTLRDIYPECVEEPKFLAFLLFYLRREGVTTLICETQPGTPDQPQNDRLDSELRAQADNHLYTWRVNFSAESRVAIAAVPPIARGWPVVVRELKWEPLQDTNSNDQLIVDPRLEMYEGLSTSSGSVKPSQVPLKVLVFGETECTKDYIRSINDMMERPFVPTTPGGSIAAAGLEPRAAFPADAHPAEWDTRDAYDQLKSLTLIQDNRLDHTLLFMIDEFWALASTNEPPRVLRQQRKYMFTEVYDDKEGTDPYADPFAIFHPSVNEIEKENPKLGRSGDQKGITRRDFFRLLPPPAIADIKNDANRGPDRIPFTWNFAFITCCRPIWLSAFKQTLPILSKRLSQSPTTDDFYHRFSEAEKDIWPLKNGVSKPPNFQTDGVAVGDIWTALLGASAQNGGFKWPQKSEDKPAEDKPAEDKPAEDKPAEDKPAEDKPAEDKPAEDKPAEDKPAEDKPAEDNRQKRAERKRSFDKTRNSILSWRVFLEACVVVARHAAQREGVKYAAWDFAALSGESLSSMVLEMWASEIHQRGGFSTDSEALFIREWRAQAENKNGLLKWLKDPITGPEGNARDFAEALGIKSYALELYKVLLLLTEVSQSDEWAFNDRIFDTPSHDANRPSVATRHWYTTAAGVADAFNPNDPQVPLTLPGHFTMRGDWFVACAAGSRSWALADRAQDLLSSHRSNVERLQAGIGLPTRHAWTPENCYEIRSRLMTYDDGFSHSNTREGRSPEDAVPSAPRGRRVSYGEVLDLAPIGEYEKDRYKYDPSNNFRFLFRSGFDNYARHTRLFQRWTARILTDMLQLRRDLGSQWVDGFEAYDWIDAADMSKVADIKKYETFKLFQQRLSLLIEVMNNATFMKEE